MTIDSKFFFFFKAHPSSPNSLYFALLEQYLLMWSKNISNSDLEKKITLLLQNPAVLSAADRALFLCQTHKFRPGVLFIFEKTKLYGEILQYYASDNNFDSVISTCRRYDTPSIFITSMSNYVNRLILTVIKIWPTRPIFVG